MREKRKNVHDPSPQGVLVDFQRDFNKRILDSIEAIIQDDRDNPLRNYGLSYLRSLRSMIEAVNRLSDLSEEQRTSLINSVHYAFAVRPFVIDQWDQIRFIFQHIPLTDDEIDRIIFLLKPSPMEVLLDKDSYSSKIESAMKVSTKPLKTAIGELSLDVGTFEKVQNNDYVPFHGVNEIRYDIGCYKKALEVLEAKREQRIGTFKIDEDIKKSRTTHIFWKTAISQALKEVNRHCHNNKCEPNCPNTHPEALTIIAELLKILYPTIWEEDIPMIINKIRSME